MMTIHEVSKLAGVSVRTLHYYDAIGLLPPTALTEAGYPTIQRRTNLHEYLCGDMPIPAHFGDGSWADTRLFTQVFLFHVFIDKQLPEFFITHRHKYLLRTDIRKMLCRLAEHSVYCSHTAKAYSNT